MPESNLNSMTGQAPNSNEWTLQAFSEINGQPWMALQERGPDGSIERQLTGFEHELRLTAEQYNITPRVLPPTSEEDFYGKLTSDSRDYELGRQFAADPSLGIPQHLAPINLDQFSHGMEHREFEQKIRSEERGSSVEQVQRAALQTDNAVSIDHREAVSNPPAEQRHRAQPDEQHEQNVSQSYGIAV